MDSSPLVGSTDSSAPPAPLYRLYSPGQVAGATLFGGPIAGCWIMASNFRSLGAESARRAALIWGSLGTVGLFALAYVLPKSVPNSVTTIPCILCMYQLAKKHQGAAFDHHVAAGGRHLSSWRVVGIGLAFLVAELALLVLVFAILPERFLPD